MLTLAIPASASTPAIAADWAAGLLTMSGDSYPENSFELFQPVIDWVEAYLGQTGQPLTLSLSLLYLNTSSIRAMMDILDLLQGAHDAGRGVRVEWLYDPDNERVAELAAEFREDYSFPFDILARA